MASLRDQSGNVDQGKQGVHVQAFTFLDDFGAQDLRKPVGQCLVEEVLPEILVGALDDLNRVLRNSDLE